MSPPDGVKRMNLSRTEVALTHLRSLMDGDAGHWAWVACIGVMKGGCMKLFELEEDPRDRQSAKGEVDSIKLNNLLLPRGG